MQFTSNPIIETALSEAAFSPFGIVAGILAAIVITAMLATYLRGL